MKNYCVNYRKGIISSSGFVFCKLERDSVGMRTLEKFAYRGNGHAIDSIDGDLISHAVVAKYSVLRRPVLWQSISMAEKSL